MRAGRKSRQRLVQPIANPHRIVLGQVADGDLDPFFSWSACMVLALSETISASYPVTAVVIPAAPPAPARWRQITAAAAVGSALGATVLVVLFHHPGWVQLYARLPALVTNATWSQVMAWVSDYGQVDGQAGR
jgi:hypothetical protein